MSGVWWLSTGCRFFLALKTLGPGSGAGMTVVGCGGLNRKIVFSVFKDAGSRLGSRDDGRKVNASERIFAMDVAMWCEQDAVVIY